ncbi:MAG: hypothetical protein EB117_10290 [Betaproteobacteria bacterium]|nr:hypothetical protein [Betaproteobacteria bacterium]
MSQLCFLFPNKPNAYPALIPKKKLILLEHRLQRLLEKWDCLYRKDRSFLGRVDKQRLLQSYLIAKHEKLM